MPENKPYASVTKYDKKIVAIGDSHLKIIKWNLFKNSSDNAQGFIKSFVGAETELKKHYATSSLKEQKPDVSERSKFRKRWYCSFCKKLPHC